MLVTQAVALQSDSPVGMTNHGFNALNSNAVDHCGCQDTYNFLFEKIKEKIARNYLSRAGRGLQNLS